MSAFAFGFLFSAFQISDLFCDVSISLSRRSNAKMEAFDFVFSLAREVLGLWNAKHIPPGSLSAFLAHEILLHISSGQRLNWCLLLSQFLL